MPDTAPPPPPEPHAPQRSGVRFGGLRLAGLILALVWLGVWNPWLLVTVLAFLLMITLHEFGHYYMAKRAGMKVTEFFLAFGPKIWSVQRGETEYGVKVIPAGAYVKIPGMVNIDEVAPEDEGRTYRQKSFWQRIGVAVAGSGMHFILALVLIYVSLVLVGQPGGSLLSNPAERPAVIEEVVPTSGADAAGIEPGDEITVIAGTKVSTAGDLIDTVGPRKGTTVPVTWERDGVEKQAEVDLHAYTYVEDDGTKRQSCGLGIVMAKAPDERVNPAKAIIETPKQFGQIVKLSAQGLGRFFSPSGVQDFASQVGSAKADRNTEVKNKEVAKTSPCAPGAAAGSSGSSSGGASENRILSVVGLLRIGSDVGDTDPAGLISLFALINIFIGMFNLIPLLPFDGGHVAIAVYERIQEKRLHRTRYFADVSRLLPLTYVVVLALGMLFISSLYLDIINPVGG